MSVKNHSRKPIKIEIRNIRTGEVEVLNSKNAAAKLMDVSIIVLNTRLSVSERKVWNSMYQVREFTGSDHWETPTVLLNSVRNFNKVILVRNYKDKSSDPYRTTSVSEVSRYTGENITIILKMLANPHHLLLTRGMYQIRYEDSKGTWAEIDNPYVAMDRLYQTTIVAVKDKLNKWILYRSVSECANAYDRTKQTILERIKTGRFYNGERFYKYSDMKNPPLRITMYER